MSRAGIGALLLVTAGLWGVGATSAQDQTVGLFVNDERSFGGYTLFPPNPSTLTYLIDNEGKLVRSWTSDYRPGLSAYLLATGHLLRTAKYPPSGTSRFSSAGGRGGRVEEFAWDGTLLWAFDYSTDDVRQHHDIEILPNGNVLLVAWEHKTQAEAIAAGRDPALLSNGELWPDHLVEVAPSGQAGGTIVWEWHAWDHLIQDYDAGQDNHGTVADHPELIDLNYRVAVNPGRADWLHINAVDYNEALDQILLSAHGFSELWVIDHSTTIAEAAGHTGGNSGRGGDILYRWGNAEAYGRGDSNDRRLFALHDAQWVPPGHPGAANILIFNNGTGRADGNYSSVDEIVPPVDAQDGYYLAAGSSYGPDAPTWIFTADPPESFYAPGTSGAQRLPNGNTLITEGPAGTFLEVTSEREIVWRYVSPIDSNGPIQQGEAGLQNGVFRAYRHGSDDPALDGKDLTPGDPIELYTRPRPVPDGAGPTEPLTCSRITPNGDRLHVGWDAASCQAEDHNLLYGSLADVAGHGLQASECAIGTLGTYNWLDVPDGDLFFLIVGVDELGIYESSWGTDSTGAERYGTTPSGMCGVTTKDWPVTCP